MTMPKAPVNEDYGMVLWQDDVRFAREALVIGAVAESQSPEGFAKEQLRLGGGGVDVRHPDGALFF